MTTTEVYTSPKLTNLLNNLCKRADHRSELKQELYLILHSIPQLKWDKLNEDGVVWVYVYRIVKNMYHSHSSPFYRNIRSHNITGCERGKYISDTISLDYVELDIEEAEEDLELRLHQEGVIEEVWKFLNININWYDSHLFQCAYIGTDIGDGVMTKPLSYREIQKLHTICGIKISKSHIHRNVVRTKTKVLQHLKINKLI